MRSTVLAGCARLPQQFYAGKLSFFDAVTGCTIICKLHILLAGEGLGREQRVWSRLCGKEPSAEHD